jgi:hypothetical protein
MNEKIKQLAEQSGNEVNFNGYNAFYNEKFAELIIQECIENIEQFDHHINPAKEIVPTIVSQIKHHFCIE